MNLKDTTQVKASVISLIGIATKHNLISSIESQGYMKLSKDEPIIIFGLLCQKFYSLGATKLWKEHGGILATLNVCYPSFAGFIKRATLSKADKFGNRSPLFIPANVNGLIKDAFDCSLITIEEKQMYDDLFSWDVSNCDDIEKDILLKVIDWDYPKLKEFAPSILEYIKNRYPDWFGIIVQPYQSEIKKRIENN
jgi:hypothetical protein